MVFAYVLLKILLEQYLTPEKFGEMLCEDLELPHYKFVQPIADSIRSQVLDFESVRTVQLPSSHTRVLIKVSFYNSIIIFDLTLCLY
jgi:hypothetical protein